MTTNTEIRQWAVAAGHDVPRRGRLGDEWRARYAEAHPDEPMGDNLGLPADDAADQDGGPAPAPVQQLPQPRFETGEIAPTRPESAGGTFGRSGFAGKRRGTLTREARPAKKRISLEEMAAEGWGILGDLVGSKGFGPTARVLKLQAPVAGVIIEDSLRGTLADRVLQPLARGGDATRQIGALLGPPMIVSLLTVRPEMAPRLLPMLRRMLRTWVLIAGPKMKAIEKREAKALADMGVEDASGLDDMIEVMIADLFAPPEAPPAEAPRAA